MQDILGPLKERTGVTLTIEHNNDGYYLICQPDSMRENTRILLSLELESHEAELLNIVGIVAAIAEYNILMRIHRALGLLK